MSSPPTPPSDVNQPPATRQADPALLAAWRRFLDYDYISTKQKKAYTRIRNLVITAGLLAASFAVFITFVNNNGTLGSIGQALRLLLQFSLVILPIISVGLTTYGRQFASSTAWIEYRVSAEALRSAIYGFRMRAGAFSGLNDADARRLLLSIIEKEEARIYEKGATLPYMRKHEESQLIQTIDDHAEGEDDGLTPLSASQYIDWRLRSQYSWYISKIRNDYERVRRERVMAIVIGGTGAVLAAIGAELAGLVAVTTAMGVALTQYSDVRMFGATYGIYHLTASKLRTALDRWDSLPDKQQDPEHQRAFIQDVEKILREERELWSAQAIQAQASADQSIDEKLQSNRTAASFTVPERSIDSTPTTRRSEGPPLDPTLGESDNFNRG